MESTWAFMAVLFILSFLQGLPHGLQFSTLPAVFRIEGLDFKHLSHMKMLFVRLPTTRDHDAKKMPSVLFQDGFLIFQAPWIIKPVYAPMIDNYLTRYIWMLLTCGGEEICANQLLVSALQCVLSLSFAKNGLLLLHYIL